MSARLADRALQALTLIAAYALKLFYGTAGVAELRWILEPTATLVSWAARRPFHEEAHAGFFSPDLMFLIAPECAGVNFFVVVLCTAVFGFVGRLPAWRDKLTWVAASACAAYGLTIVANSGRILVAIAVRRLAEPAVVEALHRVTGVTVYFLSLCAFAAAARAVAERWTDATGSAA